eukprot:Skav228747  [mRNA]  locus=scaffold4149:43879:47115:- [translate_table: standard]
MGGNVEEPAKAASRWAFRLLAPWQESFAICQADATTKYNEFFCGWDRLRNTQQKRARISSQDLRRWCFAQAASLPHVLGFWWSFATMILIWVDMSLVPVVLAWPETLRDRRFCVIYFQLVPAFWVLDLLFFIGRPLLHGCLRKELPFFLCKILIDGFLITMDIVTVLELIPEEFKAFKLIRLLRTGTFRTALNTLGNYVATVGSVNLFYWAQIFEGVLLILLVNHFLACLMFYAGLLGKRFGLPNWLDEYDLLTRQISFQYMNSFNLVLAQYTPAPFQFQPQNELEQVMVLIIICTCLPLLGSQIGRISGTLNVLKERSSERDRLRRDLHRWLKKTSVPVELVKRILDALEDVLTSSESPLDVKEPTALTFLPSALTKELSVVKTGQQLECHPFFKLLMDDRLQVASQLTGAFRSIIAVLGEEIFHRGRKAEGLYVSLSGRWKLDIPWNVMVEWPSQVHDTRVSLASMRGGSGFEVREQKFMGELCLYTELKHSTTLSTLTFAKALVASADDFIRALVENPSVVVAIHEYAVCLLQQQMSVPFEEVCWELPPEEDINLAVRSTQISELLLPQHQLMFFNSSHGSNFDRLQEKIESGELEPASLAEVVKESLFELSEDGIYDQFGEVAEALIAIRAVHCAIWILADDHAQLTSEQRADRRLTYSTWSNLRGLLEVKMVTWAETLAVIVLLTIRGLPKCKQFQMLCPPIERHSRERMLEYAVSSLGAYLPSVAALEFDSLNILGALAGMLCQFNFTQFLQGENNPYCVQLLQEALRSEGEKVFRLFLLSEVCVLCSQQAGDSLDGSVSLDERNACVVINALQCLQNIQDYEPAVVYWQYILRRGRSLMYMIDTPMEYIVARLLCLTRTLDQTGLELIEDCWAQLSVIDQSVLHEIFLADGFNQNAFVFMYLPVLLIKAMRNPNLGLSKGLQFLVEIYQKLMAHRCFNQNGPTVCVDLGSVALIMEEADDLRTLSKCLDHAQIIKARDRVVLHLTGASYQVLSGQLVEQSRHSVLLEHLAHQQGRVEALLRERENRGDTNRQGSLTSLNSRTSFTSRTSRGSVDSAGFQEWSDDPVIKSNF